MNCALGFLINQASLYVDPIQLGIYRQMQVVT